MEGRTEVAERAKGDEDGLDHLAQALVHADEPEGPDHAGGVEDALERDTDNNWRMRWIHISGSSVCSDRLIAKCEKDPL